MIQFTELNEEDSEVVMALISALSAKEKEIIFISRERIGDKAKVALHVSALSRESIFEFIKQIYLKKKCTFLNDLLNDLLDWKLNERIKLN